MAFSELIALYLFLGGAAAGAFAVLSVVDLYMAFAHASDPRSRRTPQAFEGSRSRTATHRRVGMAVYSVSFAGIVVALFCLLADLGRPEAFYFLFLYPTPSFMSIGSFALAAMTACLSMALAESVLTLGPAWEKAALLAKGVGAVLAVVVMVYTGLLLETVVAVPLWRSGWLPVLFLLSALSCGIAVVMLAVCACEGYRGARRWLRALAASDAAIIAAEGLVTVLYLLSLDLESPTMPIQTLLFGDFAWLFWFGFAACGMVFPFALELDDLFIRRTHRSQVAAATAVLVLAGGLCLRFALVLSGIHTAA